MSVHVWDRKDNKLDVIIQARALNKIVRDIVKQHKNIPKSDRWLFAYDIKNDAHEIYRNCRKANRIHVTKNSDYVMRRDYMIEAQNSLEALEADLAAAIDAGNLRDANKDLLSEQMEKVESLLSKWRDSDRKRYAALIADAELYSEQNIAHQLLASINRMNELLYKVEERLS